MGTDIKTGIHTVTIAGGPLAFPCGEDDTILSGGLRAGIGLPHECLSGGCGKCYFDLAAGAVEDIWPEAKGLSPRARERGRRLACQSRPLGDCTIKLRPDPALAPPIRPARRPARLVSRRMLAPGMAEFAFAAEGAARFLPGQFALLQLPGVAGRRAYSMSNLANEDGRWEFVVRRVPGGAGTGRLFEMEEGAALELDGPYGNAYLRTDTGRDIICIAGGSGLSPIISIARAAVADDELLEHRRITVFYGGRGPDDLCTTTFWQENHRLHTHAECHVAISDPTAAGAADWTGHRGFIHEIVQKVLASADMPNFDYYLCGPAPMVEALVELLETGASVPRGQIHYDSFF
ncbi:2Fe-2S iron-sulfur cluster-binding protein [Ancylobacter mangrovi]|uniref:2Fe-2S iron-sulfur cluster-binding protein n=1 Tax=Ancylobacter mangrovi TaxID=2972472 RepID=UPI002163D9D1|nr:2Fe-2S iron-sulfur cluster-binding protein [Ancylobacter mangrovi]MCS0502048.1 FAD-binding oxidoreductase [Ancylobacter mangrovi]